MTAEVAEASLLTPSEARRLTDKIKVAVEGTWHLIEQAYTTRAWDALGYQSWDDYCTREFGTSRLKLPREERQEVVASLRESGLSVRAIAEVTGNSVNTVLKELPQVSQSETPARIQGKDGKSYAPTKPSRIVTQDGTVDTTTGELAAPAPTPVRDSGPRVDVVREVNKVLYAAGQAAQAADLIKATHLRYRNEEAAVWVGRLSKSLESLQRLHDALMEASA